MPLLKREPDIFPTNVFERSGAEEPWWVAHVRSRQEKALARYLRPLEVPYYLPLIEHRVRRRGRSFVSYLPLFPGYLFFRGPAAHRQTVLGSRLAVRTLDVFSQSLLDQELNQLRGLQESGASLVPARSFAPGDPVRIVDGPFRGYTGIVLRGAERPRLVVSISMLRKAVVVEFERGVVIPLPSAPSVGIVRSAVA